MGKFEAGKWIMCLLGYFFVFFIISWCVVGGAFMVNPEANTGIQDVRDPGFQTKENPFSTQGYCGQPSQEVYFGAKKCQATNAYDEVDCTSIPGCSWIVLADVSIANPPNIINSRIGINNASSAAVCQGNIDVSGYGGSTGSSICDYALLNSNRTICELHGCTWQDYSQIGNERYNMLSGISPVSIWSVVGFMTGFHVTLDIPPAFIFLYSFLFFWIEFVMLIWSIYMALPFAH